MKARGPESLQKEQLQGGYEKENESKIIHVNVTYI